MNWSDAIDVAVKFAQIVLSGWLVYGAALAMSAAFPRFDFSRGFGLFSMIRRKPHRYPADRLRTSVIDERL